MQGSKKTRGPRRFSFTYEDIAEVVGLKPKTISNHVYSGIDLTDLRTFAAYVYNKGRIPEQMSRKKPIMPAPPPELTPEQEIELEKRLGPRGRTQHAAILDVGTFGAAKVPDKTCEHGLTPHTLCQEACSWCDSVCGTHNPYWPHCPLKQNEEDQKHE